MTGANSGGVTNGGLANGTFTGIQKVIGTGDQGPTADTLTGTGGTHTWNLTGPDSGNIAGSIAYSGIANVLGGSGNDTFMINVGATVSGTVDGGASFLGLSTDTLNYSNYVNPVTVNLKEQLGHGHPRRFAERVRQHKFPCRGYRRDSYQFDR